MNYPAPDDEELKKIPQAICEQLIHIQWTLVDVSSTWNLIDQIYGEKENIALLRRASAYGYHRIRDILWEYTILAISRLADPPQTAGKKNLTLPSLKNAIENQEDTDLLDQVNVLFEELSDLSATCKQFRNKILAHSDFKTALGKGDKFEVKVKEIDSFISKAKDLVNNIRDYFGVTHLCFDMTVGVDASGIVKSLQVLEQFRKLRNDAVRKNLSDIELCQKLQQIKPL